MHREAAALDAGTGTQRIVVLIGDGRPAGTIWKFVRESAHNLQASGATLVVLAISPAAEDLRELRSMIVGNGEVILVEDIDELRPKLELYQSELDC